jgi:hypothetical protein
MTPNPQYPCPACGFLQFEEPPGSYDICRLCGWEDDHVQLAHPRFRGGANHVSLVEAQQKALRTYPLRVMKVGEWARDPSWRPLTDEEAEISPDAPRSPRQYFDAAASEEPGYYWRK